MKLNIILFLAILFLSSCYEDSQTKTPTVYIEYPEIIIEETNVTGIIVDDKGNPLNEINLNFSNLTNTENISPYFNFSATYINKLSEILEFQHPLGFTLQYPLINLENSYNYHSIVIPSTFKNIQYNPAQNLEISINDDINISIDKKAFLKNGNANNESQTLFYMSIDPQTQYSMIPGQGRGLNNQSQPSLLVFDAVFFLEINDNSNHDYSIDNEKLSLQSNYENNLYYLDFKTGFWLQHDATLNYQTGYYAYAKESLAKPITIKVKTDHPLSGIHVQCFLNEKLVQQSLLNNNNETYVLLPKEEWVEIKLVINNEIVLTEELQIIEQDQIELDLSLPQDKIHKIKVSPRDCNDQKLDHTLLEINDQNIKTFNIVDLNKNLYYYSDSEDLVFSLFSKDLKSRTNPIELPLKKNMNIGRQYFCDDIDDTYLVFSTEQNTRILTQVNYTSDGTNSELKSKDEILESEFKLKFKGITEGEYTNEMSNIFLEDKTLNGGYKLNCYENEEGCGFNTFTVNFLGSENGEYIKGEFSGEFWIESIENKNVGYRYLSGEFQLKR